MQCASQTRGSPTCGLLRAPSPEHPRATPPETQSTQTIQSTQTSASSQSVKPTINLLSPQILSRAEPLQSPPTARKQYFRTYCTTLRLHILYTLWAKVTGGNVPEEEKTAFYKSRRLAFVRSLIHLVPAGVALGLVVLNLVQYYIGAELTGQRGQDAEKLATLQFVAKLHELSMLASLGTALFSYVQHQLAFGKGVTTGTLLATQQFQSVSTLWSIEFWSVVFNARKDRNHRASNWLFVCLLTLCILLGVSVGPSTANLMRPRQDFYPAGGSTYWVNSPNLYPERIGVHMVPASCAEYTANALCPYGDYETLAQGHLPYWPETTKASGISNQVLLPSQFSLRKLLFCHRSASDDWRFDGTFNDLTWGTISSPGVSDGLVELSRLWNLATKFSARAQNWWSRSALTVSTVARQPLVHTFCNKVAEEDTRRNTTEGPAYALKFANIASPVQTDAYATWNDYSTYTRDWTPSVEIADWMSIALVGDQAAVHWIDDTTVLEGSSSTLAAIVVFPRAAGIVDADSTLYLCSVGSWWVPFSTRTVAGVFWTESTQEDMSIDINKLHGTSLAFPPDGVSDWTRVYPSAGWAGLTNPVRNDTGWRVFAEMARVAGLWNCTNCISPVYTMSAVENIITLMLVNGLGRMPYGSTNVKSLKGAVDPTNLWKGGEWVDELLPRSNMGYGSRGSAYDLSADELVNATRLEARIEAEGYAYSSKGTTQRLAIAVLLTYCAIAFAHLCWLVISGECSGAWDSPSETTLVALRSEKTDLFRNTGAGVHSAQTLEHKVLMRLKEGHIQMVFDDTKWDTAALELNKKYR